MGPEGPIVGYDGRREIHRWIRHQLTRGGRIVGWAWLLIPFKLPPGVWVQTDPEEVQA